MLSGAHPSSGAIRAVATCLRSPTGRGLTPANTRGVEAGHPELRIRLSSVLVVDGPDGPLTGQALGSRKARTLLALLAAERGAPVPLDRIVHALWPDDPPVDPGANVATLVSRSRRLLGPDVLAASGRAYRLAEGGGWRVDLDEAEVLVTEAAARLAAGQQGLAAAGARAALELLGTQPALVDEADDDWVLTVRREVAGLRRRSRHVLAASLVAHAPAEAARVAEQALAVDGYDEQPVRDLMRALVADGRPAAALSAYDALAARLRDDLGTAPARDTADLHLAVLRESTLDDEPTVAGGVARPTLIGRDPELTGIERAWACAGSRDSPALVLVEGEAGIGKTRLLDAVADLAGRTGGRVLRGRCHPTERSLFLQPYVDALRPVLLDASPAVLDDLVRDHAAAWVSLVPELAAVLPAAPAPVSDVELQRRRAYDAVAALVRRLARTAPVLLLLDDLQDGGAATVDLLGHLAGHVEGARVLLVGAVRAEESSVADRLGDRADRLALGALPRSAVGALAAAAGLSAYADQVMTRTAGHSLSVVECLRALADGDQGVPASLADAVLARVGRLDPDSRDVVEAAAVLGRRLDPRRLAALVDATELATARRCEELARLRLLVPAGDHYEFANDLLQECVHAALSPPLAAAYHRRAADLTSDRPEEMAEHAYAAGDRPRAAHGWLLAGEAALRRAAVEDALDLLERSLGVGEATTDTRARALLARSAVHEARTSYDAALADVEATLVLARRSGDRRLLMAALRARGGDPAVALRLPPDDLAGHLEAGLGLAEDLGDRRAEADFTTRLTVLDASRLRLAPALARAEAALVRARSVGSEDAVLLALDGLKTVWSYLGDADRLREVVTELEPLVRAREAHWLLQWVVFESAFVPAAEGRWDDARALVAEAVEVNRRSGYTAYAGYMRAYDGWFARLAGDHGAARRVGREAVAATSPVDHPWWFASAAGLLAATLLQTGEVSEAEAVARRGLAATDPATPAAGRLRCLAALAALTDDPEVRAEAARLYDAVDCPPGAAWVAGADCYLLLSATAARAGDHDLAARTAEPLRRAIGGAWRPVRDRLDALLPQSSSATSRAARTAPSVGTGT